MAIALHSELLDGAGFRHAFFTRQGGTSPAPWESLNFSTGTGDTLERVRENLARAALVLAVPPERIYFLSQVHGTAARAVTRGDDAALVRAEEGDIVLSRALGLACAVRMADCATVLLGDRASGAAAAIHAGWRGVVRGAVRAGVEALRNLTGSAAGGLVAAIGPHVERCCFEVGSDVAASLAAASTLGEAAVVPPAAEGARPHVDLRAIVTAQLEACGVRAVDQVAGCTVCDAVRFHSYRRDGQVSGRMLAAIVPAG
ncbi:MAG: peptidoglycan editing factor PgeF [Polyangiaceae bacterium]|nr:peptidoglycan editing factor PgeF [Polyangiaceae bacterium]